MSRAQRRIGTFIFLTLPLLLLIIVVIYMPRRAFSITISRRSRTTRRGWRMGLLTRGTPFYLTLQQNAETNRAEVVFWTKEAETQIVESL